jgi:putative DNA primase/helicase
VADIADRVQCPPDFVAVGVVAAAAAVIGRRIAMRPKRQDD